MKYVAFSLIAAAVLLIAVIRYVRVGGSGYAGPLAELNDADRAAAARMKSDVSTLAGAIGERNASRPGSLDRTAQFLATSLTAAGGQVRLQRYTADGVPSANVEVEIPGSTKAKEIIIVGAHYDTVPGSPGADDNGTGVAAVLELARRFLNEKPARTVRFVFFTNEEPPFFRSEEMGSYQYARRSKQAGENIVAMLSIEAIGYYVDDLATQRYPPPLNLLYSSRGNFVGFVGNVRSRKLVRHSLRAFRRSVMFPSEAAVAPETVSGVDWSDQWAFWKFGYRAVMVTDTAIYRNPHYHGATDTPNTVDYGRLAQVTTGLEGVVRTLANR